MKQGTRKIELLSPAGSFESMIAAVSAGCDAVYIGGKSFGARALADNLDKERMIEAIEYMHVRNKKIYITVNTLLKNSELEEELYDYLLPFYEKGADAVIVQDTGVLNFIHKHFPKLPIHASTQMTITMAEGAEVLKNYGITRFVAARELSLEEIRDIRGKTKLEIECFIHGALCYSYSGQCLLSSMIGGRSGNRGRCAQPCRMQYKASPYNSLYNISSKMPPAADISKEISTTNYQAMPKPYWNGGHILSPKDMCTLQLLPELMESGIDSFKIEGRMKRYEYAAGVTRIYRKHMDIYHQLGRHEYIKYCSTHKEEYESELTQLKDLYNRGGFCGGYFKQHNGENMMSMLRPNHNGVLVGKVTNNFSSTSSMEIRLIENTASQDILEVRGIDKPIYEFTLKEGAEKGKKIIANYLLGLSIRAGQEVYRTKNNSLLDELKAKYYDEESKIGIKGRFEAEPSKPIHIKAWVQLDDESIITAEAEGITAQQAVNQPITEEKAAGQINKTSDTPYFFEELEIDLRGNVFFPISGINELRRNVLSKLKNELMSRNERSEAAYMPEDNSCLHVFEIPSDEAVSKIIRTSDYIPSIIISINNMTQLQSAIKHPYFDEIYYDITDSSFEDIKEAADMAVKCGKAFYILLPHIFRKQSYEEYAKNVKFLDSFGIDGYIIRNFEEYYFLKNEYKELLHNRTLRSDYMLYSMNKEAAGFYGGLGISRITAPVELGFNELLNLDITEMELICYGRIPLMVSAQCIMKNMEGCIKDADKRLPALFLDRMNKELFAVPSCRHCYNTIYESNAYSLLGCIKEIYKLAPRSIRLSFTTESEDETASIINAAYKAFKNKQPVDLKHCTKGHFLRGCI